MLCVQVSYSECGHESVTSEPFWDLSLEFPPQSVDPVLMINIIYWSQCVALYALGIKSVLSATKKNRLALFMVSEHSLK